MLLFLIIITTVIIYKYIKEQQEIKNYEKSNYSKATGTQWRTVKRDKGLYGEFLISQKLEEISENGKVLHNVYIPRGDVAYTEIDLLYIGEKGIYVIESKNYSGWIFGSEKDQNWTQVLEGGVKNKFFNPIIQNKVHIDSLKEYLRDLAENVQFYSVIVFSERCELKSIPITTQKSIILKRDSLINEIKCMEQAEGQNLQKEHADMIYERLKYRINVDENLKKSHISGIKEGIYGNGQINSNMVCPRCKSWLVVKNGKYGEFFGCTKFPKCRYTRKL